MNRNNEIEQDNEALRHYLEFGYKNTNAKRDIAFLRFSEYYLRKSIDPITNYRVVEKRKTKNYIKWFKQFAIYTIISLAGMMVSHFVPHNLFWYWVAVSLLIGHIVNIRNYK